MDTQAIKAVATRAAVLLILSSVLTTSGATHADVITFWNEALLEAVRNEPQGPLKASRAMAMVHAAMYDAVNSVDRKYYPYHAQFEAALGTSKEAAAAAAAHRVLTHLFPAQQTSFDSALVQSLAGLSDGSGKASGISLGKKHGDSIIILRANDGSNVEKPYSPGTNPGEWRPTPPDFTSALAAGWGNVTPFSMLGGSQFRPPAPPTLRSAEYATAFNEVKALGAVDSPIRSQEQTEIGYFWAYDRYNMGTPLRLYNQITQTIATDEGNTLEENARLFALVNIAMADAAIASWDAKYIYNFWRPITAIREADLDGNPFTEADPDWTPLGAPGGGLVPDFTPPFPSYTAGHSVFGAATFETLANFYDTDDISFTISSDELPGVFRTFDSFSAASEENGLSRIYLGVHWSFDNTFGLMTGNQVANWVFANQLQPVPEPSTFVLFSIGLLGLLGLCWQRQKQVVAMAPCTSAIALGSQELQGAE
jgi:hypothetical protein